MGDFFFPFLKLLLSLKGSKIESWSTCSTKSIFRLFFLKNLGGTSSSGSSIVSWRLLLGCMKKVSTEVGVVC